MIDFHTHILPLMDDGSKSVSMSYEMLKLSHAQNVDVICATPHYYSYKETLDNFLTRRNAIYTSLLSERLDMQIPEIKLGAEVSLYHDMSYDEQLRSLCIDGSNCILIEMPFSPWTAGTLDEVYSIISNLSLTPVLAHVERYPDFYTGRSKLSELLEMGALLQINAESVISWRTRKLALKFLKDGICLLGSDCHGIAERPPNMGDAYKIIHRALGRTYANDVLSLGYSLLSTITSH